jgi:hypothetical protein
MFTEEEEARCKYLQKGKTNFLVCWAMFVVGQCTLQDQFCSCRSWKIRVNGEPGNYASSQKSCSHIGTVVQILDLHGNSLNQSIPWNLTQLTDLQIPSLSFSISFQVPSPEIRSIWHLSPRTETSGVDLFLQSSEDFPNWMFCPGLSIIRPDRFPEISLFVTSWKLSIRKEINGQVPSLIFRVCPAPSISRLEWEPTVWKPPC